MNKLLNTLSQLTKSKLAFILFVSFLFLGFIIVKVETPKSFLKKVLSENSKYIKHQQIGELKIGVRFQSIDELCSKQVLRNNKSDVDVTALKEDFDQTIDFELILTLPSETNQLTKVAGSTMIYQELINYLAFDIQEDLILIIDNQEYKSDFVHFERNYGTSPIIKLQFGFNKSEQLTNAIKSGNNIDIRFDADRFNLGPLYFHYNNDLITYKPIIIY
jgi:hypothetical protein